MLRKLLFTTIITLPLIVLQAKAQESEDAKARLNRQETFELMAKVGKMPAQEQKSKIDSISASMASSQEPSRTPRSDFLFCYGLGFLGNYKAQRCVGNSYEHGTGIVEDLSEAYAWYSVALENAAADEASKTAIEADKERVQNKLLAAYPHPSEEDLEDMTKSLQSRITQYQEDAKKAKK